jgi:hypothetical protein
MLETVEQIINHGPSKNGDRWFGDRNAQTVVARATDAHNK